MVDLAQRRRLRLDPEVTAPRAARDFVARACSQWHLRELAEPARLVVSELVSNAVVHSGTGIEVELSLDGGALHMRVHDDGEGLPAIMPHGQRTIGGVGLEMVSRAVESWGVTPDPHGGKDVWCVLAGGQAHLSGCQPVS